VSSKAGCRHPGLPLFLSPCLRFDIYCQEGEMSCPHSRCKLTLQLIFVFTSPCPPAPLPHLQPPRRLPLWAAVGVEPVRVNDVQPLRGQQAADIHRCGRAGCQGAVLAAGRLSRRWVLSPCGARPLQILPAPCSPSAAPACACSVPALCLLCAYLFACVQRRGATCLSC
jgi:hypothetical protein